MRIVILTGIFPPDMGGPATYVPNIARALVAEGHQVKVVTLSDAEEDDTTYPFEVCRVPRHLSKAIRSTKVISNVAAFLQNADLLYVNGLPFEGTIAAALSRKPTVHRIVGDLAWERTQAWGWTNSDFEDYQREKHGTKVEALKRARNWVARRADAVVVPSQFLAAIVSGWGVSDNRIHVVHNPIWVDAFLSPDPLPRDGRLHLVTAARLIPHKGVREIIEVLHTVPDVRLTIIGDGPERKALEDAARSVSDRVLFAGILPRRDALTLIKAHDVLVLNSTYEGYPHVVAEALILGIPVVATAVGGSPELIEDRVSGRLIPPRNRNALAQILLELSNDRAQVSALRQGARRRAVDLQPLSLVRQTMAVFDGCCKATAVH
jgi:glycosyltransferase involved in cell wall biosynthesis